MKLAIGGDGFTFISRDGPSHKLIEGELYKE